MDLNEEKYYLQKVEIPIYEDSEYDYKYIKDDEILVLDDKTDESLDQTSKVLDENKNDEDALNEVIFSNKPKLTVIPPSIDDFIRSFLLRLGLTKTLDCFQLEWFEKRHRGELHEEDISEVPDIYVRNQQLDEELKHMREEKNKYKSAALGAKEMHVKLRAERDFHKLQHRRVLQEKNKLINDIKRIREHYASYEPTIEELQRKYQVAMKEKMLSKLERDRVCGQIQGLQMTLQSLENATMFGGGDGRKSSAASTVAKTKKKHIIDIDKKSHIHPCEKGGILSVDKQNKGPSQRKLAEARQFAEMNQLEIGGGGKNMKDSVFPVDSGVNDDLAKVRAPPGHLTRVGGFKLSATVKAHDGAVTCVRTSKDKKWLCTTSDDNDWKLWALDNMELTMTGNGHKEWVSSATFDPTSNYIGTCSGDTSIKIWDISLAKCVCTLSGHSRAVWTLDWHDKAPFIVSGGMDSVVKVWDVATEKCRSILRGHSDSVNSVQFVTNGNIALSGSADKTLCLWDCRTAICGQTILGHEHSINSATFNTAGTQILSCDSFGYTLVWDTRHLSQPIKILDLGYQPANEVRVDMGSGSCAAVCSNDGSVKMIELNTYEVTTLVGHEDSVLSAAFDTEGNYLVSGSTDCTLRVWS